MTILAVFRNQKMKYLTFLTATVLYLQGFTQVVPNVSVDSLADRLFPIYSQALKTGIYDLPRDTTWRRLKAYESVGILFQVPENWVNLGALGSVVEVAFDASDLYFPAIFNDRPILVGIFLLNQSGSSLDEARNLALKDYRSNVDRVFEQNYSDTVYNFKIQTGQKAYILHTRFLRKSSTLNQSRYDLIVFSEKLKKAYSVMVSVQYSDPSYAFEKNNGLDVFATRIFSQVTMK